MAHRVCTFCGLDKFKCPEITVFLVRGEDGTSSLICEKHFRSEDVVTYGDKKRLVPGASTSKADQNVMNDHGGYGRADEENFDDHVDSDDDEDSENFYLQEDSPTLPSSDEVWTPLSEPMPESQSSFSQDSDGQGSQKKGCKTGAVLLVMWSCLIQLLSQVSD